MMNAFLLEKTFDIAGVKGLFFQVVMLLGVAIVVYLYINFRSNKSKRDRKRRFDLGNNTEVSDATKYWDMISVPLILMSKVERIITANAYANAMLAQSATAIEGRQFKDLLPEDVYKVLEDMMQQKSTGHQKIEIADKIYFVHIERVENAELLLTFIPVIKA